MQTVHFRINDAATGHATPCRVRIVGPDGVYYPPLGRLREFATGPGEDVGGNVLWHGQAFALVEGSFEIILPPGEISIEVHKGPEYRSLRKTVPLRPGQAALRLSIERWADLRSDGWFSGDTQASLPPHAALLEAAAEDLAVVNVLAAVRDTTPPSMAHILAFSGQEPALASPRHLVVVNTRNDGGELGCLSLLNCHRVVYPLRLGDPVLVGYTLADWCDQCHRKGGLVVWSSFENDPGGEALADLVVGKIDAVQASQWPWSEERRRHWYDLLASGVRVPLVGGSGKESNTRLLGSPRTYARLRPDEEFTYRSWIEAVRAGRTFVTNGPLLSFTVNGQEAGGVVDLEQAGQTVHVQAEVRGLEPCGPLEVIHNGQVIATADAVFDGAVTVMEGGWLAARCGGNVLAAHSSPVYVPVGGAARSAERTALERVLGRLERTRAWIEAKPDWESERQKQHLVETFHDAVQVLQQRSPA